MQNVVQLKHHPLAAKKRKAADKIGALPFAKKRTRPDRNASPRCFWSVRATGKANDAIKEQRLGSEYALLALDAMSTEKFTPLLGWIVLDMIGRPQTKSVIIGFMQTISEYAVAAREALQS